MSRVHQSLHVIKQKGASLNQAFDTGNYLIVVKKTGYLNLTIGNQRYYYDERTNPSEIDNSVIIVAFAGGKKKKAKVTPKKKRTITIRKK